MRGWSEVQADQNKAAPWALRAGLAFLLLVGAAVAVMLAGETASSQTLRMVQPKLEELTPRPVAFTADSIGDAALLTRPYDKTVTVSQGDTLMALLTSAGAPREQAHAAVQAMRDVFSPRALRPGQEITLTMKPALGLAKPDLLGLSVNETVVRDVIVARQADGAFSAEAIERPLVTRVVRAEGRIDSSLYDAAVGAGVPLSALSRLITVFSFDVDFQRDVQPGDRFAALFEVKETEDGRVVEAGDILIGEMVVGGKPLRVYRYIDKDGQIDWFDGTGKSVRKALLTTPIEGARISSGFGMRRHPILGYSKMHKGLDFAAPTGTPIFAAGDGVVEKASRFGAYGNYVRIRHNGSFSTAYAHMSRFGKGMKSGVRVRQGQIIGYVGTTGRSTGPHLHYEVIKNGEQVNPRGITLPTGRQLEGRELVAFQSEVNALETRFASLAAGGAVAAAR